jgi:TolA-binding protein
VLRFQEVIDKHKSSPWAAYAMLRQGECFEAQGQKDNARLFYEDVVRLYPKSKAAKEAKAKLGK